MSLWQKTEQETPMPPQAPASTPHATSPITTLEKRVDKLVNIGQSIQIKGQLTGNEDLTIDGLVDGKIVLKDHNLTIGANGRITAEVEAKTVVVKGKVTGNITADDKVEIASSGSVQGDLRAPRVALADGSTFKGAIDMEGKSASRPVADPASTQKVQSSRDSAGE